MKGDVIMKKIIALILCLLLLCSCAKKADSDLAMPYEPEKETVIETPETEPDTETSKEEPEPQKDAAAETPEKETVIETPEPEPEKETNAETDKQQTNPVTPYVSPEIKGLEIRYSGSMNSLKFTSVDKLYNFADLVVIASPDKSYKEAKQVWCDTGNNTVDTFEKATITHSYTLRKFKVHKVLKGEDKNLKSFDLYVRAISDGKTIRLIEGEYVAEKGGKYLLFLYKSPTTEGLYLPFQYQGKFDMNTENAKNNLHIDQNMFKQVKEKFKDEFK